MSHEATSFTGWPGALVSGSVCSGVRCEVPGCGFEEKRSKAFEGSLWTLNPP